MSNAIQKVFTSRINANAATFVGSVGRMFYDPETGILRISDGVTPGGVPVQLQSTSGRIGDIQIIGNGISSVFPNEDVNILSNGNGSVNLIGQLSLDSTTGQKLMTVDANGSVDFFVVSNAVDSGVDISGNPNNEGIAPQVAGVILHITGMESTPARIYADGQNSYAVFAGRRYNGTTDVPTPVNAGDLIVKFGGSPYLSNGTFPIPGSGAMYIVATEDQTATNQGNQFQFFSTPQGSNVEGLSLAIDSRGIVFSDSTIQNTAAIPLTELAEANGVATLDSGGHLEINQVPPGLVGAIIYKGAWDAANNSPFLTNGVGTTGWEYAISTTGYQNLGNGNILYTSGDWLIYSGSLWQQIQGEVAVTSFNGRTGAVTLNNADVTGAIANNAITNQMLDNPDIIVQTQMGATGGGTVSLGGTVVIGTNETPFATPSTIVGRDATGSFSGATITAASIIDSGNLTANGTAHFGAEYLTTLYPNALVQIDANVNSYSQITNQNHNSGSSASTDFVAQNDVGTDTSYYIDMGINGSNYNGASSGWTISGPNDAYLYNASGNLTIGDITPNSSIIFHTGGAWANNQVASMTMGAFSVIGNVSVSGNSSALYFLGNGSQLSGIYSNANAASYLLTNTGNIAASYYHGNGSQLSGIYSNVNAASYLLTNTGNISAGNISATGSETVTGNVSATYFLGNGSQLSGIYSNANAASYLLTNTGNIACGNLSVTGNVSATYFLGNGSQLSGIYSNANVASYLLTNTGNISAGNISVTGSETVNGNVSATFYLGNGSQLSGIYSNANAASYLLTNTGNIACGNISVTGTSSVGAESVTGNLTAGNISTLGIANIGTAIVTGNLTANNATITNRIGTTSLVASGNVTATFYLGNGSQLSGIYSNANAASYLLTNTGNISAGNLSVSGNTSSTFYFGNGSQLSGIYSNANAASYLLTNTGNISAGNLSVTGTSSVGTSIVSGTETVTGNLTAGNISTLGIANIGTLIVTGNLSANNETITNLITTSTLNASGNITANNATITNLVSANNVSASNLVSGFIRPSAGTTNLAPLVFTSGSLLTYPTSWSNRL